MADMIHALVIELVNMLVNQRVEDMFPILTCLDNAQGAQQAQVVRHRRLAHAKHQAKIANAEFSMGQ